VSFNKLVNSSVIIQRVGGLMNLGSDPGNKSAPLLRVPSQIIHWGASGQTGSHHLTQPGHGS